MIASSAGFKLVSFRIEVMRADHLTTAQQLTKLSDRDGG